MKHLIYVTEEQETIAQLVLNAIDNGFINRENNIIYDVSFFDNTVVITLGQLHTNDHNKLYYVKSAITFLFIDGEIGEEINRKLLQQEQTYISFYNGIYETISEIHSDIIKTDFKFFTQSGFKSLVADIVLP